MGKFVGFQNLLVTMNNFTKVSLYDSLKKTLERSESASNETVDFIPQKVMASVLMSKITWNLIKVVSLELHGILQRYGLIFLVNGNYSIS